MEKYRPIPKLFDPGKIENYHYNIFAAKLSNLCTSQLGLNLKVTLPARAFCSDESQDPADLAIKAYFHHNTFDYGRVGGRFAVNRSSAAAHHGRNIVVVNASHVGYNPERNEFGLMFRPLSGLSRDDPHAYSTCCGKLMGVVEPFQKVYDKVKRMKINLVRKKAEGREIYCIAINNALLNHAKAIHLTPEFDMMIKQDNNQPRIIEARANSTVYEASDDFIRYIASSENPDGIFQLEKPTPIGNFLTSKYFHFGDTSIASNEEGTHLVLQALLPYMNIIVASKFPAWTAANIMAWNEFYKAVTEIRHNGKELELDDRTFLMISGVNIDWYDHELSKKNNLLGPQIYFCPMAAFYKPKHEEGSVMEHDEIIELLEKQKDSAESSSLDLVVRNPPKIIKIPK